MRTTRSQMNQAPGLEWEQATYADYPAEVQNALFQQRSFIRAALAGIDGSKIKLVEIEANGQHKLPRRA